MCNQYMFISNAKYSSYSLWDGVMRGRPTLLVQPVIVRPPGASFALLLAPLADAREVPRGASSLPSKHSSQPALAPRPQHASPSYAVICPQVLELLSGLPASTTSRGGLFWGVHRGQVLGRALKPAFGLSPRHVQGFLKAVRGQNWAFPLRSPGLEVLRLLPKRLQVEGLNQ